MYRRRKYGGETNETRCYRSPSGRQIHYCERWRSDRHRRSPAYPVRRWPPCGGRTKHSRILTMGANRAITTGFRQSVVSALSHLFWLRTAPHPWTPTRKRPLPKSSAYFRGCWRPWNRTILGCIARRPSIRCISCLAAACSNSTTAQKPSLAQEMQSFRAEPCTVGTILGMSLATSSPFWLAHVCSRSSI